MLQLLMIIVKITELFPFFMLKRWLFIFRFFVPLLSLFHSLSLPPTHHPIPSPQDRNILQEQKHKGRPSSLLGGVLKGGPGGALRARCV